MQIVKCEDMESYDREISAKDLMNLVVENRISDIGWWLKEYKYHVSSENIKMVADIFNEMPLDIRVAISCTIAAKEGIGRLFNVFESTNMKEGNESRKKFLKNKWLEFARDEVFKMNLEEHMEDAGFEEYIILINDLKKVNHETNNSQIMTPGLSNPTSLPKPILVNSAEKVTSITFNDSWDEIGREGEAKKFKKVLEILVEHSKDDPRAYANIAMVDNMVAIQLHTPRPIENVHIYGGCMKMDGRGVYSIFNFGGVTNCDQIMHLFNREYGDICKVTYSPSYTIGYEMRGSSWIEEVASRGSKEMRERSHTIG